MNKLLLFIASSLILFSCNNAPKEVEDDVVMIAENSDWTLDHLKGMVQLIEQSTYTADSTGQIGEMDSCCTEFTTFNEDGFAIKFEYKDRNGLVTEEISMELMDNGKFKSAIRMENGKLSWNRAVTYDADGKILFAVDTDSSDLVSRYYNGIVENEQGQILEGKIYKADSVLFGVWTRKYIDGLETGRGWTDSLGVETLKATGEVNKDGLLSKMTTVKIVEDSTTTSIETYVYDSFDETGNWTQRSTLGEDGKTTKVEKRVYSYFK